MFSSLGRMDRFFSIVLCLAFSMIAFQVRAAEDPLSAIRGKVVTSDGQPASEVSVQIKEKNRGTLTNEKGEFIFRKVQPGKYTLQVSLVGYSTIEQQVEVAADQIVAVEVRLEASEKELDEVVINASRNRYKASKVSESLRFQGPILEIPQNIQTISSQLMADQMTFDVVDGITRNVSGAVRVGHWDNQYAQIRMRGSKLPAFRNGMNIEASWGPTAEDAGMIENIEFVKGPAGVMLAAGEPGGFYNVVTKKPTGQTKGSATLSAGSFSTYRAALDFDGKLSKDGKLLYRFNVAGQQKDFHTKYNYSNRHMIAPVLKYLVDENTSITLEYTFQGSKYLANGNYTFSPKGFADKEIGNDFFYGDVSLEPGKLRDHSVYLYFDRRLNDKWKMHAQTAYFNFAMEANSVWANYLTESGDMSRYWSIGDEAGENRFGQFSISGEERTGSIRHRIIAGADFGNKKFWGDFRTLNPDIRLAGNKLFNVYNPQYGIPFTEFPPIDRSLNVRVRAGSSNYATVSTYGSAFAQDELGFLDDKLRVSLALRYTYAKTTGKTKVADIEDEILSPRVGVSYSIDKNTAVYVLYDQSFVPTSGTDWQGNPFKPVKGNDIEAGIKREWFGGRLRTSVTAYQITRENALVDDPDPSHVVNGQTFKAQLGETTSKGIEVDVTGEILPGLNTVINYAFTESKITKETNKNNIGNRTPNTPKHITNAWVTYTMQNGTLKGLGASVGVQSQTDRNIGTTKVSNFPDYFRADAGLSYRKGQYSLALLVNNVLNHQRLMTAGSITNANGSIAGSVPYYAYIVEPKRNMRFSVTYNF